MTATGTRSSNRRSVVDGERRQGRSAGDVRGQYTSRHDPLKGLKSKPRIQFATANVA
jgi:hypothetical protein